MLELYTWRAPNAQKVSVMLEEVVLPYAVRAIDLERGEQRSAEYLAVNPNGKVPVLVDRTGPGPSLTLTESNAILVYLAEQTGRLLPSGGNERAVTLQWLMFQTSTIGPTFHDAYHFLARAAERMPGAIEYFTTEVTRVLRLLDARLTAHEFLAEHYSIADVATYPWIHAAFAARLAGIEKLAGLHRWYTSVSARPAVARGMAVPAVAR